MLKSIHGEIYEYYLSAAHYVGINIRVSSYESNNYTVAIGTSAKMPFLRVLWQFCNMQEMVIYGTTDLLILELLQEREME